MSFTTINQQTSLNDDWKRMNDEGVFYCQSCGEETSVPIDVSTGLKQEFVANCHKCSFPNLVHVEVENDGDVRVWVTGERA